MSQSPSRRRFIQTTAGSSIGALITGNVSGEANAPTNAGRSAIPDAVGVAKKLWVDPSIAAWPSGPWRKVHIEYHTSRHILPLKVSASKALYAGRDLPVHRLSSGRVGFLVPRVHIHEVVSLELS
jgi:hypothetical protein